MIPTPTTAAIGHPDQQLQQITARIRDRDGDNRRRHRLPGGGNDTLNHDEAPGCEGL